MRGAIKVLLLFFLLTSLVNAEIFRCDENGKVIYQQDPCKGGSGKEIKVIANVISTEGLRGRIKRDRLERKLNLITKDIEANKSLDSLYEIPQYTDTNRNYVDTSIIGRDNTRNERILRRRGGVFRSKKRRDRHKNEGSDYINTLRSNEKNDSYENKHSYADDSLDKIKRLHKLKQELRRIKKRPVFSGIDRQQKNRDLDKKEDEITFFH